MSSKLLSLVLIWAVVACPTLADSALTTGSAVPTQTTGVNPQTANSHYNGNAVSPMIDDHLAQQYAYFNPPAHSNTNNIARGVAGLRDWKSALHLDAFEFFTSSDWKQNVGNLLMLFLTAKLLHRKGLSMAGPSMVDMVKNRRTAMNDTLANYLQGLPPGCRPMDPHANFRNSPDLLNRIFERLPYSTH